MLFTFVNTCIFRELAFICVFLKTTIMFNSDKPVSAKNLEEYFKDDLKKQSEKSDKTGKMSNSAAKANHPASESSESRDIASTLNAKIKIIWHGKLTKKLGLPEDVSHKHFKLICEGKHPLSGEELIKAVKPRIKTDHKGREYETLTRRAGLPQTVSAPTSAPDCRAHRSCSW